ncbi:MAG: cell division protein FtsK [Bacteroides sp. SM23_62_1]|nr:MAG: cell division protein FtsK [Bacteroides sp. SM23_62_1]
MPKKEEQINSTATVTTKERIKTILGIFLILFSLYNFVIFISFLFTWKVDQSFNWSAVFSGPEVTVENWGGKFGAWFSNLFINKWFGISSLCLPFIILIAGFMLLRIRLLPLGKLIRSGLIATILFSVILGFIFGDTGGYLGSGLGGGHGYFLSRWLISFLGITGTAFLLFILLFALIIFTSGKSLSWMKSMFKKHPKDDFYPGSEPVAEKVRTAEESDDFIESKSPDGLLDFKTKSVAEGENPEDISINHHMGGDGVEMTVEQKKDTDPFVGTTDPERIENFDPTLDLSGYKFPPLDLLTDYKSENSVVSDEELINNKNNIVETLGNYKIQIDKIKATIGPTVTLYEIVPAPGVRISRIKNLEDDIALSLSALGIRIIAPIPGRGTIGIEVPNSKPEIVSMRSIIGSRSFQESKFELAIGLGKTISNDTFIIDLTKMPHLLIAGATGQGKSVGLNTIIASILYKKHPAQVKFIMVDPKKVELSLYNKIEKHYLAKLPDAPEPIITDTKQVVRTLHSLIAEMEDRYNLMRSAKVRDIKEYNAKFIIRRLNPKEGHRYLPYIILIVDEFADLIMTAGREIEMPLARLAQLARAIGIHLVIATQRPSVNIITGAIKANFPARIAFRVISMMDSRTILDSPGANQLVGRGDMLVSTGSDLLRLQCAFVDTPEIEKITDFIHSQQSYPSAHILPEIEDDTSGELDDFDPDAKDELFDKAARLIVEFQQGSTSLIQRKFSIGYNRAGRIIDQLEAAGIVGPYEGSKARQVLIKDMITLEQILNSDISEE